MTGELEQVAALLRSWRTQGELRQSQCLRLTIHLAASPFSADNHQWRNGKASFNL